MSVCGEEQLLGVCVSLNLPQNSEARLSYRVQDPRPQDLAALPKEI